MPEIGDRFGRWIVVSPAGARGKYRAVECMCDCGSRRTVNVFSLMNGRSTSCGCWHRKKVRECSTKHGASNTREYHIWENMKSRCQNQKSGAYRYYGGRGIKVCERWQSFDAFYEDMGPLPSPKHTIDRIDGNGNYEPGNCRWATRKQQQNNIRNNIVLKIGGVAMTLPRWAERSGTKAKLIDQRLRRGWPPAEAVFGRGGMLRSNTSGYRGVHWHKGAGKWVASLSRHGKNVYLGLFETPENAHAAYLAAKDGASSMAAGGGRR